MFARFKETGKPAVNVNTNLVRDFAQNGDDESQTKLNFLGGDSMIVPFSENATRGAFRRAMSESQKDDQPIGS